MANAILETNATQQHDDKRVQRRVVFDNGDECPVAEHRFLDVVESLEKTTPLLG